MNTRPNTPFGWFLFKIGLWHPTLEGSVREIYDNLEAGVRAAIREASAWIAIVSKNIDKAPVEIFTLIQKVFPWVTEKIITDTLAKLNTLLLKIDSNIPQTFDDAIKNLLDYLTGFTGNTLDIVIRGVVTVLTDIFLNGKSQPQTVQTVLELVYRNEIKGVFDSVRA